MINPTPLELLAGFLRIIFLGALVAPKEPITTCVAKLCVRGLSTKEPGTGVTVAVGVEVRVGVIVAVGGVAVGEADDPGSWTATATKRPVFIKAV